MDDFEYIFPGYMVLNKKKTKGYLYFKKHKVFFQADEKILLQWDKMFYNDISLNVENTKIKEIIFSKLESCITISHKRNTLIFTNDTYSFDKIQKVIKIVVTNENELLFMEKAMHDKCKQAINLQNKLSEKLDFHLTNNYSAEKQVPALVAKVKEKSIKDALINIPIEQLNANKSGIRISALKAAHIDNIQQVFDKQKDIERGYIHGVGELTAQNTILSAKKIRDLLKTNMLLTINVNDKTKESTDLLKALFVIIKNRDNQKEFRRIKKTACDSIITRKIFPLDISSFNSWFWLPDKKKNEIAELSDDFHSFIASEDNRRLELNFLDCDRIKDIAQLECWSDYLNNTAPYHAILEQYISINTNNATNEYLTKELQSSINEFDIYNEFLKSSLRKYQVYGTQYILHQENVLLGDEMGLGKTIQAIATIAKLKENGKSRFLIVCPLSVLVNWGREITKHSYMDSITIYGKDSAIALQKWLDNSGIGITTYETLKIFSPIGSINIDLLIVDEAHYIKNPKATRTKNLLSISKMSQSRLFMTGTPLENKVEEMCFLISCLQPNIAQKIENMKDINRATEFKREIAPVYLRRLRKDVLMELPELIEMEEWGILNEHEQKRYLYSLENEHYMSVRRVSWNVENMNDSTKVKRVIEICNDAKNEGRKIVIFSFFKNTIKKLKLMPELKIFDVIDGSVGSDKRQNILDGFEKSEAGSVLLSQIVAGGIGLNIQCASVVILCEPQLKPSIEKQAISRVYRMGQARTVTVHRLLVKDTIEERIMQILDNKQNIFDEFADESLAAQNMESANSMNIKDIICEEKKKYHIL